MTLADAVDGLKKLDDEDVLYVRRPWAPTAECMIVRFAGSNAAGAEKNGLAYFLEAATARAALEVFEGCETTLDERLRLLIYYAENAAFPDRVYE